MKCRPEYGHRMRAPQVTSAIVMVNFVESDRIDPYNVVRQWHFDSILDSRFDVMGSGRSELMFVMPCAEIHNSTRFPLSGCRNYPKPRSICVEQCNNLT